MYTTFTDSATAPDKSNIVNILYTSIPSYVASDHVSALHISVARDGSSYHAGVVIDVVLLLETSGVPPSPSDTPLFIRRFAINPWRARIAVDPSPPSSTLDVFPNA